MFLLEEVFLEGKHGDGRKLMCLWISVVIKWSVLVRIAGWESNTKESWGRGCHSVGRLSSGPEVLGPICSTA